MKVSLSRSQVTAWFSWENGQKQTEFRFENVGALRELGVELKGA